MRILPISPAKSTGPIPSLVARADAVLAQLRADVLSSPLPSMADEVSPESFEKQLSAALNRDGCSLLGAVVEELDECRDQLVVDGSIYRCTGPSPGKILSSFGEVAYERSRYRRRNCEAVFPADERIGVIGGFWSPYAARLGSLSLALAPVKDCEGLFRELGGMRPSATAQNHLVETLGSACDAVQETAQDEIRQAEGVPEEAASVAVSIDGAMLGMRRSEDGTGQPILTFRALGKSGRFTLAWNAIANALPLPELKFRNRTNTISWFRATACQRYAGKKIAVLAEFHLRVAYLFRARLA